LAEDARDLSLHLDPDAVSAPDLQEFLQQVLEAAGGQAGILTTWEEGQPQTHRSSQFGFEPEIGRALARLVEEAAPGLAAESDESVSNLQRRFAAESLRAGLGPLHAVAMPLRIHGHSVGLFCMLHPTDAPGFLRDSPQMYSLVIDRLEIVVQNARLLQHLLRERLWLEALVTQSSDGVAILDRDGLVIEDRFGQVKEHPACGIERQNRLAFSRLLREIGLDHVPADTPRAPVIQGRG